MTDPRPPCCEFHFHSHKLASAMKLAAHWAQLSQNNPHSWRTALKGLSSRPSLAQPARRSDSEATRSGTSLIDWQIVAAGIPTVRLPEFVGSLEIKIQ